jgi:hypothetical protein
MAPQRPWKCTDLGTSEISVSAGAGPRVPYVGLRVRNWTARYRWPRLPVPQPYGLRAVANSTPSVMARGPLKHGHEHNPPVMNSQYSCASIAGEQTVFPG